MIPFAFEKNPNVNGNNTIFFMDKQCLKQDWKQRYAKLYVL